MSNVFWRLVLFLKHNKTWAGYRDENRLDHDEFNMQKGRMEAARTRLQTVDMIIVNSYFRKPTSNANIKSTTI